MKTLTRQNLTSLKTPQPSLIIDNYQDLSDTTNLIASKTDCFWCYTHLADLPLEKQSPDPRYCQQCYELLVDEAKELKKSGHLRRQWWIPKHLSQDKRTTLITVTPVVIRHDGNMSTSNRQNSTVDIFRPTLSSRCGPKNKVLPLEKIAQLVKEGLGSKAIAGQLTAENIPVSYKTIQRLLKKQSTKEFQRPVK